MNSQQLIQDLRAMVQSHLHRADTLKALPNNALTQRPSAKAWNALECLQHLNLYGEFYLPEIQKRIQHAQHAAVANFSPGWFGNKSALSMLPQNGKVNKMNTFKSKNTFGAKTDYTVIETFEQQQTEMLDLLTAAENVDLNKVKTRITLPLLKFRLGDTLRFVIYHNERHIQQAERAAGLDGH